MKLKNRIRWAIPAMAIALVAAGCGGGGSSVVVESADEYNAGYDAGFFDDTEYFYGYDDSFFTVGSGPILYEGDLIPFSDRLTYQAGVWDGQFDAYNDGYFVAYRLAFIIGFSEGYDNAFWSDYLDFLFFDLHTEYLHGGFSDGYNDGFSEGRIFGAFDYESVLAFDWLDAFLDWESGTDLYFEEVDKGTGEFGPVFLYEWGTNPHEFALDSRDAEVTRTVTPKMHMRQSKTVRDLTAADIAPRFEELVRGFTDEQASALDTNPLSTSRSDRDLTLTTTWLERIDLVLATSGDAQISNDLRSATKRTR